MATTRNKSFCREAPTFEEPLQNTGYRPEVRKSGDLSKRPVGDCGKVSVCLLYITGDSAVPFSGRSGGEVCGEWRSRSPRASGPLWFWFWRADRSAAQITGRHFETKSSLCDEDPSLFFFRLLLFVSVRGMPPRWAVGSRRFIMINAAPRVNTRSHS